MRTGYISKDAALKIAMIAVVPYIFSTEKFQEFCTGIEKLVRDYPEEPVNCKTSKELHDFVTGLRREASDDKGLYGCCADIIEALCIELDRKNELIDSMRNWTPASEGKPPLYEDVLVTDGEDYAVGFWRDDAKAWDSCNFGWLENRQEPPCGIKTVTHWVKLPDLPKPEAKGTEPRNCYNCEYGDDGDSEFGLNIAGHCWKHNGEVDFEQPPKMSGCDEWKKRSDND